jgi:hypothetical protein
MYRYKSVLFCLNLLNSIFSINSNMSFCCKHENPSEKHIWSKFERDFGSKTYSTQVHHLLPNHFQFEIEYGINQGFLVDLVDNVRCNSRWIRIAIGLNCVGGLGSHQGFKIVRYLEGSTSRKRGNQLDVRCGGFRFEDGARLERWNQR